MVTNIEPYTNLNIETINGKNWRFFSIRDSYSYIPVIMYASYICMG